MWSTPRDPSVSALVIGNIGVAALLLVVGLVVLVPSRQSAVLHARDTVGNLSSTLGSELSAELRQADQAASTIADVLRSSPLAEAERRAQANGLLRTQLALLRFSDQVGALDADGLPTAVVGMPLPDTARMQLLRMARETDGTVIALPWNAAGEPAPAVVVSRRLTDAKGNVKGVVYVAVGRQHYQAKFSRLSLGSFGAVTLRSTSLSLVARHAARAVPGAPDAGRASLVSPELRTAYGSDSRQGWYTSRTTLDGVERVTAYRSVEGYPLVVLAGLATEDFLREWHRQAASVVALLLLVAAVVAAYSFNVFRQRRRQAQSLARIQTLAREQAALLNNELVGMARVGLRRHLWANRAMARIFGYDHGELDGLETRALYLDEASYGHVGKAYAMLWRDGSCRLQLKMRRKDGSAVWIDLSGAPVSPDETLWMLADISALKESEERAQHAALHDALTCLPNRVLFWSQLEKLLMAARRTSAQVVLCYLDLDDFKRINDSHGHAAGDLVLQAVAHRMAEAMRGHDVIGRLGGDEFGIALSGTHTPQEIESILGRLLAGIAQRIALADGTTVQIAASIGYATFPDCGDSLEHLRERADSALYAAKRSGKNRAAMSDLVGS